MKKLIALALAAMLLLSAASALAYEHDTKAFPTAIPETWDYENYYACQVNGFYEGAVTVGENEKRSFNIYYADGILPNAEQIFITVPDGVDVYDFLVDSGWKQVADENKLILNIMSPANGAWGEFEQEAAYVDAVCAFVAKKPFIAIRRHNAYWAAYDNHNIGLEHAMTTPPDCAGFVAISDNGLTEEEAAAASAIVSKYFDGENNPVQLPEVAFAAWIVSAEETENVAREVEYFRHSDAADGEAQASDVYANTVYYAPNAADPRFALEEIPATAGVYYTQANAADVVNYEFTNAVWTNTFSVERRAPQYGQIMEYKRLGAEDPGYTTHSALVYGGDYKNEKGITVPGDMYSRYWYTYTPANIEELSNVPVLYVIHGSGGSPSEMGEGHYWRLLADELGFIMIVPQGSLTLPSKMNEASGVPYFNVNCSWSREASATKPNDLLFFDFLNNWMFEEFKYGDKIDPARIFVAGQSMGGGWTTTLAQCRPQMFAAAAPFSFLAASSLALEVANTAVDIPVCYGMGQKDDQVVGGFSKDGDRVANGKLYFDYWTERYGLTEKGDLDRTWADFTFLETDPVCTEDFGVMNAYIFDTAKGYIMFTGLEMQGMGHSIGISEGRFFLENYMNHYTRDPETKVLYYDGEVVDTPVNMALYEASAK